MRGKRIYTYLDGTKIKQIYPFEVPITHQLYQFKKHIVVVGHHVHYQCNYIYVAGDSQLIILN